MSIYLYIKQHTITGKLYFGKTTSNPEKYLGSGLHWTRHIKQHGREHVVNLWYDLFEDQNECTNFALELSIKMNIVESDQWLNLKPENGLDGGTFNCDIETRNKISEALKGKPGSNKGKIWSKEIRQNMSKGAKGKVRKPFTEEHRLNMSKSGKGNPKPKLECPHCKKIGGNSNMVRYHFNNCKLKV